MNYFEAFHILLSENTTSHCFTIVSSETSFFTLKNKLDAFLKPQLKIES
jgi:hypothetical protein